MALVQCFVTLLLSRSGSQKEIVRNPLSLFNEDKQKMLKKTHIKRYKKKLKRLTKFADVRPDVAMVKYVQINLYGIIAKKQT